jgi:hypothetical protein
MLVYDNGKSAVYIPPSNNCTTPVAKDVHRYLDTILPLVIPHLTDAL